VNEIKDKEEKINGDKTITINGSLLQTLLLILILVITFGGFCMQVVFNYMESRDRKNMMDLQAMGMVAGSVIGTEQLAQMRDDIKTIFEKKKKEVNRP
jgi:uncharacterized membrane protein YciS (DUF1049 family)